MMTPIKQRVSDLLARMTLDEKLAQIGSCWIFELQNGRDLDLHLVNQKLQHGIGQISRLAGASTLEPAACAKTANDLQRFLLEKTRLGIPAIIHEECCAGAMALGGTTYPQMLGLAGTFQPELARQMTIQIREQLRAIGAHQGLAPVLDVARDPRWGRSEETFGEDPILASHFGMAYVQGLQAETLEKGVIATGKHFIGHSLSQGGLNCGPVHAGMHEIFDTLLPPFQAAIRDAGLAGIMNSYPQIDGEVVAASRRILGELLRGRLGFDGLVVADYEAIQMIYSYHHAAADPSAAACMALEAGIEVETPSSNCYAAPLKAALESGELSMELVDSAVCRHLQKKFELGLFENPFVDEGRVMEVFDTPEQRSLARQIARQSIVLLKNEALLPLKKTLKTLAVIGPNADSRRNLVGDYTYASGLEFASQNFPQTSSVVGFDPAALAAHAVPVVTVLEGIKAVVSPQTQLLFAPGCDYRGSDRSGFAQAVKAAGQADAVILVLGDRSGLTSDCTCGEFRDSASLRLPGVQEELAKEVIATGKPVAVVLIGGRPLAIPWLSEHAQAILEAWLPGEEGGTAVAEALFGDHNPGGKLAMTFPRSAGQLPLFYNYKPSGRYSNRYGDYVDERVTPLYPFGHGLSYTTFDYQNLTIDKAQASAGESVSISLDVANTGSVAGDEVVQLYVCDEVASLPRPVKELKGYLRIRLNPGETKRLTFDLPVNMLAYPDQNLDLVLEPGRIKVMLGSSSEDIRLQSSFEIPGKGKNCIPDRVFVCPVTVR